MKRISGYLLLTAVAVTGCAHVVILNNNVDTAKLSYPRARSLALHGISKARWGYHVDYKINEVKLNPEEITLVAQRKYTSDLGEVQTCHIKFTDINASSVVTADDGNYFIQPLKTNCEFMTPVWKGADGYKAAGEFMNGIEALEHLGPEAAAKYEKKMADFKTVAENYRSEKTKPDLTEEGHKYQLLGENAFDERRYEDALDYFEKALDLAPWWPPGHYNRALLHAQLKNYSDAIDEMKMYLELVPDAQDARAARDKMYIWEDKAEKNSDNDASTDQDSRTSHNVKKNRK